MSGGRGRRRRDLAGGASDADGAPPRASRRGAPTRQPRGGTLDGVREGIRGGGVQRRGFGDGVRVRVRVVAGDEEAREERGGRGERSRRDSPPRSSPRSRDCCTRPRTSRRRPAAPSAQARTRAREDARRRRRRPRDRARGAAAAERARSREGKSVMESETARRDDRATSMRRRRASQSLAFRRRLTRGVGRAEADTRARPPRAVRAPCASSARARCASTCGTTARATGSAPRTRCATLPRARAPPPAGPTRRARPPSRRRPPSAPSVSPPRSPRASPTSSTTVTRRRAAPGLRPRRSRAPPLPRVRPRPPASPRGSQQTRPDLRSFLPPPPQRRTIRSVHLARTPRFDPSLLLTPPPPRSHASGALRRQLPPRARVDEPRRPEGPPREVPRLAPQALHHAVRPARAQTHGPRVQGRVLRRARVGCVRGGPDPRTPPRWTPSSPPSRTRTPSGSWSARRTKASGARSRATTPPCPWCLRTRRGCRWSPRATPTRRAWRAERRAAWG